jgi:hypothetical protein
MRICGGLRMCHDATTHAFVEPAPAPQPPADATTNESGPAELGPPIAPGHEWINGSLRRTAGPPVTGEGDAALAESIAKYHDEHAQFGGAGREFHERAASAIRTIYASGIARGRVLGARDDAIEDVGRVIADNGCDCEGDDCPTSEATCEELGHEPCLAHRVERAIAARRAGRGE